MDIDGKLSQANGRLRAANVGVAIEVRGDRLILRATLPPKPGSKKSTPYQQRISPGFRASLAGLKAAEFEARKIGALLDCKQFDWSPYLKSSAAILSSCGDWVERFEASYFSNRGKTPQTLTTWDGDYLKVFRRLPQDKPLSIELLQQLVEQTPPNKKQRKRYCMALSALADFAGIPHKLGELSGNYSPAAVEPRDLPDDRLIAEWFSRIPSPAYRWVYGMIATYGIRPHEVFRLDLAPLKKGDKVLQILENTKTGQRRVWPCYPEWFEQFDLASPVLPEVNLERANVSLGGAISRRFRAYGVPFVPYDLRHCWAIRTLEFGLDISLAAQQMGHSVAIHSQTYHRWISDRHHQRAFELLMLRGDRPLPPTV